MRVQIVMRRLTAGIIAFLIAALIPAISFSVFTPVANGFDLLTSLGAFPVFFFFSLLATVVFGVPVFVLMDRFGMAHWWSALTAGLAIGGVVAAVLQVPNPVQIRDVLLMAAVGAVSGAAFWFVWRMGTRSKTDG